MTTEPEDESMCPVCGGEEPCSHDFDQIKWIKWPESAHDNGMVTLPINPSLDMLDAGWGICGTELSGAQPNPEKMERAKLAYKALLEASEAAKTETGKEGEL